MSNGTILAEPQPLSADVLQHISGLKPPEGYEPGLHIFTPTDTLAAIATAGMHLRHNPDRPVASAPVYLTDEQQGDFASQVLASIINASIEKQSEHSVDPSFTCVNPRIDQACSTAEKFFIDALNEHNAWAGVDVITQNDIPVLLTKRHIGARTCLTLCDITIDGIPYPAGSIAKPLVTDEALERELSVEGYPKHSQYDIGEVTSLAFIRLSLFALPLDQREPLYSKYGPEAPEEIREISVQSIASRADSVLPKV